ncbi:hypothetical protein LCX93_08255 [Sulfurimonas sp. SWIR-19]|uniref:hypothetical protein n=1 Tax=Sulfurimonas sp. SWIR-19 TaxID=2878390 RepID=UPI001CF455D2|nr:hypothetical protein [Sulfurimonas sp. SWIR-19]UCM99524.1 hypothetical protein LCX93_08255 [Sulfurimonas sp. SWIR-19]
MKKFYLILMLLLTSQLFSNNLAWVDEQIEAIKPPRIGVSEKEISRIKDPFIFLHKKNDSKKNKTGKKTVFGAHANYKKVMQHSTLHFRLDAILNKSAMINGKWYKQGKYIYGYKLAKVGRNSVLLVRKNKKLLLSTKSKSKKIKIYNK